MSLVLGIDLGGTKTHAIVMDDRGNVLGMGKSPGANYTEVGLPLTMDRIREAADQAMAESGVSCGDIAFVGAGLTCIDWDYERDMFTEALREKLSIRNVAAVNDCIIAMRAGTTGTVTAVICAGTGMNCAVRNGDDEFIYGYYVDERRQGGHALSLDVMQAVFDAELGFGEKTALTRVVPEHFGVKDVTSLLHDYSMGKTRPEDFRSLPVLLGDVAAAGDRVSIDIWRNAGKRMAQCVTARARIMGILEERVEVVLSGSIFKTKCREFEESVREEILSCIPNAVITSARFEPVVGAALLALDRLTGGKLNAEVQENLERSAEKFPIVRA